MARENYHAQVGSSWKELTAREKFILKDVSAATPLDDEVSPDEGIIVMVSNYVRVSVHNEKSDSKDYVVNIIVCKQPVVPIDAFVKVLPHRQRLQPGAVLN